ncbi:MAG: aldo/keto reductase [Acidobacteria bacterium]|nr:aldo/keto reductase [Acidobacteriota bacterium]
MRLVSFSLFARLVTLHGRSTGEIAIAWVLRHEAVTSTIVGMCSAELADGVLGAMDFRLSAEEIAEIVGARKSK